MHGIHPNLLWIGHAFDVREPRGNQRRIMQMITNSLECSVVADGVEINRKSSEAPRLSLILHGFKLCKA